MNTHTLLRTVLAGAVSTGIAAVAVTAGAPAGAHPKPDRHGDRLTAVRIATAKYLDVRRAIADGYVPTEHCLSSPDGAMGMHYLHPERAQQPPNPRRPAVLLYEPTSRGPRLAGVEYFQADADQDLSTDSDRPSIFGRPFDGPMAGHEEGMPVHYDLHVWLWKRNPAGTFAPWNPRVSC